MKYSKKCECCGQISTVFTHCLNSPMVGSLKRLVDAYEEHRRPIHLQKDIILTKNQYTNFYKLRHFGLVHNDNIGGGCYVPTFRGIEFIYGRTHAPKRVKTLNNVLVPPSSELWSGEKYETCFVQDIDVDCYKKPEDYKQEKRITLFDSIP